MRLDAAIAGNLKEIMAQELDAATKGITASVERAATILQNELRHQVSSTMSGRKLSNAWRMKFYHNQGFNAAANVYSKAPHIITGFEDGATIKSAKGSALAIPTPYARALIGGRVKPTPAMFKEKGIKLYYFPAENGKNPYLFITTDAGMGVRIGNTGRASYGSINTKSGKRRSGNITTGVIPMFILLPQVKLRKRLDVKGSQEKAARLLPLMIMRHYRQAGPKDD